MDSNYIREHRLIERYVRNELDAADTAAFEESLLCDPDLLAEVERATQAVMAKAQRLEREVDSRVGQGVRDLDAAGYFDTPSLGAKIRSAFLSPQYAMAASLALVVSLVFSGLMYQGGQRQGMMTGADIVPILAMRGTAPAVELRVPDPGRLIVLLVDPGPERYADYRATVLDRSGTDPAPVMVGDGLVPGYEEQLAVAVPGRLLPPGEYEIRLEGRDPEGALAEVSRTAFRVRP